MNIVHPNRRTVIAAATALSLGVLSTAGIGVATAHHNVTLEVDGVVQPVSGFMTTVDDVLAQAGITAGEHDEIAPHPSQKITDGSTIVVRSARPYTVTENGVHKTIWSTAASYAQVLDSLGQGTILAADRSVSRADLPLFSAAQPVSVHADGVEKTVQAQTGDNVEDLLMKAGITVSPIDRVRFARTESGVSLIVQRVSRGMTTTTQVLSAPVEERTDDSLYEGETSVIQEGADGQVVTTSYQEIIDGVVTVQAAASEQRTEPVARIVAVGTKPRPQVAAPAPQAVPVANGDVWAALAQCESGGNPSTNTGNGYYGMYQFSLPTWQSVGGSGLPSEASAAEQTHRAQILQQRSGWGQWPACSARLGLY